MQKKVPISFKFPDFKRLYDIQQPYINTCNFTKVSFNDLVYKKVWFRSTEKDENRQIWKEYLIIHKSDFAIIEYSITKIDNQEIVPFTKQLIGAARHRTFKYNRFVQFERDQASNKYCINNKQLEFQVEVFVNKKIETPFYNDCGVDYYITNSRTNEKTTPNFPIYKDFFKAGFANLKDF